MRRKQFTVPVLDVWLAYNTHNNQHLQIITKYVKTIDAMFSEAGVSYVKPEAPGCSAIFPV